MEKINKILVPVDFSDCSKNALEFAIRMTEKINATILVLNVPNFVRGIGESHISITLDVQEQIKQARENLNKLVTTATERINSSLHKMPVIETTIEMGKVKSTIVNEATKYKVDYIFMGTKGVNTSLGHYLGSVASHIVQDAPCPVMVIPEKAKFHDQIKMGYATLFSYADPFGIWKAVKLFRSFQPEVKVVHFNENHVCNANKIKELKKYFIETAPNLAIDYFSLPVKNKVEYMNDFIENQNVNMLVMYQPKRHYIESFFHKSYTREMSMHINVPLLILKERA